jgi:hypothetical protein
MSYMNYLEKKLRYSNAFSSLNSLRNLIGFPGTTSMDETEKEIVLDAIEIAVDNSEASFKKALMYGFYNTGNSLKTSALELAKVIDAGLRRQVITTKEVYELGQILRKEKKSTDINIDDLTSKIDHLMVLLNKAKKDEVSTSNSFLIKS